MLIVKVEHGKIERALKQMKRKVRNTKQTQELRERKQFTKKSVKNREEKNKAIYLDEKRRNEEDL